MSNWPRVRSTTLSEEDIEALTAQSEAEELRRHNLELIEADRNKMFNEVKQESTKIALALSEKALSEIVGRSLQSEIVKEVVKKLPKVKYAN